MARFIVTYSRKYVVDDKKEDHAVGMADQELTDDIRKALLGNITGRIVDIFNIKVEKVKKNGVLKQK